MSTNKRKLSNFLLTPGFQLKLTLYYISVGVVIILATGGAVYAKFMAVRMLMNDAVLTQFSAQSQINTLMFQIAELSLLGFVLFAITSFIFALMISHRIAGPVVGILAYINALKEGDFKCGRKLRPHDELTVIMDALHDLAGTLDSQTKNTEPG